MGFSGRPSESRPTKPAILQVWHRQHLRITTTGPADHHSPATNSGSAPLGKEMVAVTVLVAPSITDT